MSLPNNYQTNLTKGNTVMKKNTVITDYLYGAYGSNLNKDQMSLRCPKARAVASYGLDGYALKFRGVADIQESTWSDYVPLGLWRITNTCEKALDRYEGVKNGFYEKRFIHTHYGKVMFYVMCQQDSIYPPSDAYLNGIATGYFDFKLDNRLLKDAVTDSYISQNNGLSLDYLRG